MSEGGTPVEINRDRNQGFAVYFVVLLLIGVGLLVGAALRDWGFWGWFGGGVLIFTGLASLFGMAKTGGAGVAHCPRCKHAIDVLHVTEHRYLCCPGCATWLEGSTAMAVVPDEHVASYPAFEVELPQTYRWPPGCPVCGAAETRTLDIEGTDVIGDVFAMVAPVTIQRVSKISAPACDQHDDGVALIREGSRTLIRFRSLAYLRSFMALNQLAPLRRE